MKNIVDICNTNISNSLCSLCEASILDIEGAIDNGNKLIKDIEKEFNKLIKFFDNKKVEYWNHWFTGMGSSVMQLKQSCPAICKFLGYKEFNSIGIHCVNAPYSKNKDYTILIYLFKDSNDMFSGKVFDTLLSTRSQYEIFGLLKKKYKSFEDLVETIKTCEL